MNAGFTIESVDEPPVSEESKQVNIEEYTKYVSLGASRLAIRARKV